MKSIRFIFIFGLITLFLWNYNNKEQFTCNIGMAKYKQCFERHQARNDNNISNINNKLSSLNSSLEEHHKEQIKLEEKLQETGAGFTQLSGAGDKRIK